MVVIIKTNADLDIESTKKFFEYLIDIAPKYNEHPLTCVIDINETVKHLYSNNFFSNKLDDENTDDMTNIELLWYSKMPIFNTLGTITDDIIKYMKTISENKRITKKNIDGFYKTITKTGFEVSTINEFKKNSIDFMTLLETYICGDMTEDALALISESYISYISVRSSLNRKEKEKIMAKINLNDFDKYTMNDFDKYTMLDDIYYKLISEFKKLYVNNIRIFEEEEINKWETKYKELTLKLKDPYAGTQTQQTPTKNTETTPALTFKDVIGLNEAKNIIYDALVLPEKFPELAKELGLKTANFLLLYGPPGTGKSIISRAIANELDATYIEIKGTIESKYVSESETNLINIFKTAKKSMETTGENAIIYFDEITQTFNSENKYSQKLSELFKQILTDDEQMTYTTAEGKELKIQIIGSTNNTAILDPTLIRDGRAMSVEISLPNLHDRELLWKQKLKDKALNDDINYEELAKKTDGLSGASIVSIINETPYLKGLRLKNVIGDADIHSSMHLLDGISIKDPRLQIAQKQIESAIKLYRDNNLKQTTNAPEELFG